MILINLLPHREAARKRRKEAFFVTLGAAALLGGLICGAVYVWYQAQISSQQGKNTFLLLQRTTKTKPMLEGSQERGGRVLSCARP